MTKLHIRRLAAGISLLTILSTGATSAQELETFRFMFPVESVNQYHPFYIADELGYFAEEGLEVEFEDAGGSSSAIQQVLAGNAQAGLPAPSAFLNAVAQGHELRWIYSYQYANIFTLAATAQSGKPGAAAACHHRPSLSGTTLGGKV